MTTGPLTTDQIEAFVRDGFVRLDEAFARSTADACLDILWRDTGCDRERPATWTRPVVRLGEYAQPPFVEAASTPRLRAALDQVVGPGRWQPRGSLGTVPVRFPSGDDPGDAGWHVEASFPGDDPGDYMSYRINVASRGRALLMLFLFSDVGPDDAPTVVRVGSHATVARLLAPAGEPGLSFMELAGRLDATAHLPHALADGPAGTVFLCHPFLAHTAQPHRGRTPRFMAQPALLPRGPSRLDRAGGELSPVERAIAQALG